MPRLSFFLPVTLLLAVGCVSAPAPCPPPTASPAASAGLMDPALMQVAQEREGVFRIKLFLDAQGQPYKQSVYHKDFASFPKEIQEAILSHAPGGAVVYAEHERYRDVGATYEAELTLPEGGKIEVSVTADGALYYTEREVTAQELPAGAQEAALSAVPGGTIKEIEHKKGPNLEIFLVEVVDPKGVEHYLTFTPAGALSKHTLRVPAIVEVPAP